MALVRTGYSFKTAVGLLPEVASRIEEIGWRRAPITDRLSTFGFVRWTDAVKNLRPIYGVEIGVTRSLGERYPSVDWWTFLATDSLVPLHDLVRRATAMGGSVPYAIANDFAAAGGLEAIAGETSSLDLTDPEVPVSLSPASPIGYVRQAREQGRKFVATSANYFPRESDRELYRVMLGGRLASTQTYPQWLLSDEEWVKAIAVPWRQGGREELLQDAVAAREAIFDRCRASLDQAKVLTPDKPKTLRQMCLDGARRKGVDLRRKVYRERLDRELEMIDLKKFEDYFYIIADMVSWAKERMVVGPARGSSCGSLVCYLLDITAIDPLRYDLLFERFIDVTRSDLPDIDLDFSDVRREMVFKYAEDKYGVDHVARLGSVSMFKAKSILKQVGIALRIPHWQTDELSNVVIKRSMGDSRASDTIEDTLRETEIGRDMLEEFPEVAISSRMEGHPHNAGQHAAGLVITEDPVNWIVAVDGRTGATMCDKKDAEKLNLLKIDALGLTQLGIFERCLELIGERDMSRFLEKLPTDDQAAFDILNDMRFSGIFQFVPGSSSAGLVTEIRTTYDGRMDSLEDVISLTALVRPGPLGSGAANEWLRRRAGRSPVTYYHPSLEPYVRSTLGIIIYQEQVMQIGKEIGDLSWDDVTALRKAMSRSLGKEYFDQYGDRWKAGAAKRGWEKEAREKFWDDLCLFGMWAFNRSHSVAYAMVSYWCLWLKAHHPLEFAAATLDAEGDVTKQIILLRELRSEGIGYVAVDPDKSTDRWQVDGDRLIGPLTAIRGIGPAKVRAILDSRASGEPLQPGVAKALARARTEIDSLTPISDAVAKLHPDLTAIGIISVPIPVAEAVPGKHRDPVVVIGVVQKISPLNENEPARVARRGGKEFTGPLEALNLFIRDDSGDQVYAKIDRWKFPTIGRTMLENCHAGKSIYAIKGTIPEDFRMIKVTAVKHVGEMDDVKLDGSGEVDDEGDVAGGQVGARDRDGSAGEVPVGDPREDKPVAPQRRRGGLRPKAQKPGGRDAEKEEERGARGKRRGSGETDRGSQGGPADRARPVPRSAARPARGPH